jgi:hypothetical protein
VKRGLFILLVGAASMAASCPFSLGLNPFTDTQELAIDGVQRVISTEISRLGLRTAGEVLKITVTSDQATAAYIVAADTRRVGVGGVPIAGVIVDGGPISPTVGPAKPFFHRVRRDGRLFLFIEGPGNTQASVTLENGPADFTKPAGQSIAIEFEDDFLAMGLTDTNSASVDEDRAFLRAIEPTVRADIVTRLREIFVDAHVTILAPGDTRPTECSIVRYLGRAVFPTDQEAASFVDALRTTRDGASCPQLVVYGEVLPRGTGIDPGNQDHSDSAVVFTGSFTRPPGCMGSTFVTNSITNIINTLSLAGAHEAGHLLGLTHSALEGIMAAQPTLAFQRQLVFQRSQIIQVLDQSAGSFNVVTTIVQDPQLYFDNIFAQP